MIVVIADDLTGAAELAGIGMRYGMRTEVWMGETLVGVETVGRTETVARMETVARTEAVAGAETLADQVELLVIATDTRSMRREDAVEETLRVSRAVLKLRPEW